MQPRSLVPNVLSFAPFACASLVLVGAALPQGSALEPPRPSTRSSPPAVQRAADELQALARAQQILLEHGYQREAVRLEAIHRELEAAARAQAVESRAQQLLAGDIQDKAVRVGILELATEGYAAKGWETNAEALGWFTAIGQAQRDGVTADLPPVPAGLNRGAGSIMDRVIELVLGAGAVQQQLGNPTAAQCCLRLGRFYVQRELGAFRTANGPEDPDPAEPLAAPLRGLGYIDGADAVKDRAAPAAPPALDPSAGPPVDVARPPSAVDPERLELEQEIRALRARIEELQQRLARELPRPAPGGGTKER